MGETGVTDQRVASASALSLRYDDMTVKVVAKAMDGSGDGDGDDDGGRDGDDDGEGDGEVDGRQWWWLW